MTPLRYTTITSALIGYLLVLGVLPTVAIWRLPVTCRRVLPGLINKVLVAIG